MRPVIYIVREKFIADQAQGYRAAIFGAFTSKKFALVLKKKILAEVPCIFSEVEIVGLQIGQRHQWGVAMNKALPSEGEEDA